MGFDVPMDKTPPNLSPIEKQIINAYRNSDDITKEMVYRTLGIETHIEKDAK